ncbi:alpha/beta fold hydrolase [Georgenia sp. SYP-B2076]|uniref:alpha/beta fold hydrolase n=1 Tax=Georgenia sp. SYP-B2076 TaxID=2495881 RepID=UPI000F8D87F7|nr:alpha/beta hydrolase [Georgenia sp. SYP-B2076]
MTTEDTAGPVHVVLVPGFWLGGWAWDDVVPHLERSGLEPHPVTLPGLASSSEDRAGLTLADHVATVRDVVADLTGQVVLVGHSGAALVVQGIVDADPGRIAGVVYVDAWPSADGDAIFDLPADQVDLPLPSWEQMEADGNSLEGIDEAGLARFRERAVPEPAGVARSAVHLTDERRLDVPVTVICSSVPAARLRAVMDEGQAWTGELVATNPDVLTFVDLPTGHWPMFSRPADLAAVIADAASSATTPAADAGAMRQTAQPSQVLDQDRAGE